LRFTYIAQKVWQKKWGGVWRWLAQIFVLTGNTASMTRKKPLGKIEALVAREPANVSKTTIKSGRRLARRKQDR